MTDSSTSKLSQNGEFVEKEKKRPDNLYLPSWRYMNKVNMLKPRQVMRSQGYKN